MGRLCRFMAAAARLQRMLQMRCNRLSALPPLLGASWHCNPGRLSLRYCGLQARSLQTPTLTRAGCHAQGAGSAGAPAGLLHC